MSTWLNTFIEANARDVINGKLRVPKNRTEENIKLVTEAVKNLKSELNSGYDEFYEYLDNGRQWKNARDNNALINRACEKLDEKLKNWLEDK